MEALHIEDGLGEGGGKGEGEEEEEEREEGRERSLRHVKKSDFQDENSQWTTPSPPTHSQDLALFYVAHFSIDGNVREELERERARVKEGERLGIFSSFVDLSESSFSVPTLSPRPQAQGSPFESNPRLPFCTVSLATPSPLLKR